MSKKNNCTKVEMIEMLVFGFLIRDQIGAILDSLDRHVSIFILFAEILAFVSSSTIIGSVCAGIICDNKKNNKILMALGIALYIVAIIIYLVARSFS